MQSDSNEKFLPQLFAGDKWWCAPINVLMSKPFLQWNMGSKLDLKLVTI